MAARRALLSRQALQTAPLWPSNVPIKSPVSPLRSIGFESAIKSMLSSISNMWARNIYSTHCIVVHATALVLHQHAHTLPNNIIKLYKYYPFDVNYQINSKMPGFNQCSKSNVCSAGYAPKNYRESCVFVSETILWRFNTCFSWYYWKKQRIYINIKTERICGLQHTQAQYRPWNIIR